MLTFYRRLLVIRNENPVLQYGEYHPIEETPEDCFVYQRLGAGLNITVALNFTGVLKKLEFEGTGLVLLSTHLDRDGIEDLDSFNLRENEGIIIRH